MGASPAQVVAGGSRRYRRHATLAVPPGRWRGRAGMLIMAAAAGLAVLPGTMTGAPSALAVAAVPVQAAATAHSLPLVEPCPCANPLCKNGCAQV